MECSWFGQKHMILIAPSSICNPAAPCKIVKMHICEYHDHKEAQDTVNSPALNPQDQCN